MRIVNNAANQQHAQYYFKAPAQFLGLKQGGYGQKLGVSLTYDIPLQPFVDVNATVNNTDTNNTNR